MSAETECYDDRIAACFARFHAENPEVYTQIRELALRLVDKGRSHYGIAALFEVVRYHRALETQGEPYKLNNNYRALYARKLMEDEPRLAGFFATRHRPSRYDE